MTETEWMNCSDPDPMFDYALPKTSYRKQRLFALGCCRSIWHRLKDSRTRHAVEIMELFLDGDVSLQELERARATAQAAVGGYSHMLGTPHNAVDAATVSEWNPDRWPCAKSVTWYAQDAAGHSAQVAGHNRKKRRALYLNGVSTERAAQSLLLRCIIGNPFHAVALESRWRTSDTIGLARAIYDERAFDRLPILADALMDAGCEDEQIIAHCRSEGPHVRGCWVVDLVLGKN